MSLKDAKNNDEQSTENNSVKKMRNNAIEKFKKIIEHKYSLRFENFWDLHRWTVDNFPKYWGEIWNQFEIVSSKPYDEVFIKTGSGYLDNIWFPGAELNFAENLLKIRDNSEAILCMDEEGNIDRVTFAEMFEEVKLYAAAFRKNGLQKGDRVACYMTNRKESVFAWLATTSVGAIWGGPQPFYGAKAAAGIIKRLKAKFLISHDRFKDTFDDQEYNLLENLHTIAQSAPTLTHIIIVPTKNEALRKDISNIPNSCFLGDFLSTGRTVDGDVPEMVFEQLPFDHPIFVSFSSGTTGLPKGPMISTGCLLASTADFGLHYNLKKGDTLYSFHSIGWIIWYYFVASLSLGVRLFLHNGNPYHSGKGKNIWDLLSEHKVSFLLLVPGVVDTMEKLNLQPKPGTNFKNLRFVTVGGSPLKLQNVKYLKRILKEDSFIGNIYGMTENCGPITCCDLDTPCYSNELQVPSFGRDIRVFDKDGRSVIGEKGELVVTKPCPCFLIGLWEDENKELVNQTYCSTYPGIFQQHDEAYINPRTKGIIIMGRSDDMIFQKGERFAAIDIYTALHDVEGVDDYICVTQAKSNRDMRAVLFLKLKEGCTLTPELKERAAKKIESELWIDCVPEVILQVKDIPYNITNKRGESIVRKIVAANRVPEEVNIKNPQCLTEYCNRPELMNYNKE